MDNEIYKCSNCGIKLKQNTSSSYCDNCKRRRNTNKYKNIGIIILIVGFIGGIILGNLFKVTTLTYESSIGSEYNEYNEIFNFILMFCTWISTALLSVFFFAINSICYRLDLIIDKNIK